MYNIRYKRHSVLRIPTSYFKPVSLTAFLALLNLTFYNVKNIFFLSRGESCFDKSSIYSLSLIVQYSEQNQISWFIICRLNHR